MQKIEVATQNQNPAVSLVMTITMLVAFACLTFSVIQDHSVTGLLFGYAGCFAFLSTGSFISLKLLKRPSTAKERKIVVMVAIASLVAIMLGFAAKAMPGVIILPFVAFFTFQFWNHVKDN